MGPGQIPGRSHEGVVVQDVENAGHRLYDVVRPQFSLAALSRPFAATPAFPEPAAAPALAAVAVVVASVLLVGLSTGVLLVSALVRSALAGLGVQSVT